MGVSEHFYDGSPAEQLNDLVTATDRFNQLMALAAATTEEQAITASNFSRFYLTPSQELTSAVALSGLEWDAPMLSQIVELEQDQSWAPKRAIESVFKGVIRNTFMAMDSLIDQTWSRPFRIAEQMAQNDGMGLWEAYDRSGQPELSQVGRAVIQGEGGNIHTGAGWTPERYDPAEDPNIVNEFNSRYERLIAAGQGLEGMEQIWDQTLFDMAPDMPYDVVSRARDTAEATRYTVQMPDGTTEETGVSMGRFFSNRLANVGGMTLVRPNTVPATLISGSIDGVTRVGFDPLNIPADALTDYMRFGKMLVPDNAKGLGANAAAKKALEMSNDWRWWVSPRTIDKWAETRAGKHTLDTLAKSGSESEIMDILDGVPTHVQQRVKLLNDPDAVLQAIRPHLGVENALAPTVPFRLNPIGSRVLGARGYLNPKRGAAGGYAIYDDETRLGKLLRREAAEQTGGGVILDPADPIASMHNARQLLDTIGADVKDVDMVLGILMSDGHNFRGAVRAANKINQVTKKRLVELGMDEVDVDEIMKPFIEMQTTNHLYNTNLVSDPMARMDEGWYKVPDGKGGETLVFKPHAAHEAQFSHRNIVLPSVREYRQVTSKVRLKLEKLRKGRDPNYVPVGFDVPAWNKNMATWLRYKMDQSMSLWRNMALLRVGWPLRVLPDEALRIMASGYGNMFTDASHYVGAVMRGDMVTSTGDSVTDWINLQGGYGTGGFARGPQTSLITGATQPNMPRDIDPAVSLSHKNWVNEQMHRADGTRNQVAVEGLVQNLVTMHNSALIKILIDNGIDGAMDILRPGGKPSQLLRDIAREAADDSLLAGAVESKKALRAKLEQLEVQVARFTGGDFYYREIIKGKSTGRILNKRGEAVETYLTDTATGSRLTGAQLNKLMQEANGGAGIPGRSKARTVDAKRQLLMENDGNPWELTQLPDDKHEYLVDLGNPRVHSFISNGIDPGDLVDAVPITHGESGSTYADGYIFHGTVRNIDNPSMQPPISKRWELMGDRVPLADNVNSYELDAGGMATDMERARAFALDQVEDLGDEWEAVVLVYDIDQLPQQAQDYLKTHPSQNGIDQFYGPGHDWEPRSWESEYDDFSSETARGWIDGHEFDPPMGNDPLMLDETPRHQMSWTMEDMDEAIARGTMLPTDDTGMAARSLIEESMDRRKLMALEEHIPTMYDERYPLPDSVPRAKVGNDPTWWGPEFVNRAFWALGGMPTQRLLRHPFFQSRWTDEMSRLYVWVDEGTRAQIRGLVETNGLTKQFDVYLRRQLKNRGMKAVPTGSRLKLGIEEIDEMARFNSLEHVKELLYDLTKSNNFWDSMRLITPFGEAWWEVISRWANLFNPFGEVGGVVQGGQAIRNVRRPWQVGNQAQKEGFFDEDEFGNEVFNVPLPWGGHQRGGARIAAQLNIRSLFFVDPGQMRSALGPSMGPVTQVPGAIADPYLPEPLRRLTRTVLYGEFEPPDTSTAGKLAASILPTPYKRALERLSSGEFRTELASTTHQTYNALCGSGDSQYNCNTPLGSERAAKEAQRIGGQIGWLRVVNAVMLPGQPQYRGQVNLIEDQDDYDFMNDLMHADDPEFWINTGVLQKEYRVAKTIFGNDDDAWNYIYNRFGVDALNFTPSTREVKKTPTGEDAYNFIREHPELTEHADLTMWAFADGNVEDDLYFTAYNEAIRKGRRVRLSVTEMASMQSIAKGAMAANRLSTLYDKAKAAIEADGSLLANPHQRRLQLEELANWAERERNTISTQFLTWGQDANPVGVPERPTFEQYVKELWSFADPTRPNYDAAANEALRANNPELVGFVEEVLLYWNRAEQLSQNRGNQVNWWRDTTVTRDLMEGFETNPAENVRNWFLQGMNQAADRIQDPTARNGAVWMAESIFTPLLEGYDYEHPIVLDIRPPKILNTTQQETPDNLAEPGEFYEAPDMEMSQ